MSIIARSAQFAPFAALSGYDEAVKETARLTDKRLEIDDGLKSILNNKLQYILENININPEIFFTYFVYDKKKTGGKYIEKIGVVKKIDLIEKYVQLELQEKYIYLVTELVMDIFIKFIMMGVILVILM